MNKNFPIKRPKIALVLGAGGARGFAHLGVLEELEKHNIPIDMILGASIGSIVGAFYADNPNIAEVKSKLFNLKNHDMLDFSFLNTLQFFVNIKAPFEGKVLEELIYNNLSVKHIEDLKIPYAAVAVDVKSGNPITFDSGNIGKAVRASSSLPPIFSPLKYQDMTLVDGGFAEPVPVNIARQYNPELIIAVDISNTLPYKKMKNMIDIIYKVKCINYYWLCKEQTAKADIGIYPELDKYDILDDKHNEEIYLAGREAGAKAIPLILEKLQGIRDG